MATMLPTYMRAVECATPGPVSVLQLRRIPLPVPQQGQALIRILAFGINRAEMYTRQGHSPGVSFPRILGIECIGAVAAYADTSSSTSRRFALGTRVATCMGGLGREIPGSYAEYTCVAQEHLRAIPATRNLSVPQLASLPEMLQTAWGALTSGLDLRPGESLLIRGATSSIGLCAMQLARRVGARRVGATTRQASREAMLRAAGADDVFIDAGSIAEAARLETRTGAAERGGVDKVLELVGTTTLRDSVQCAREGGTVCMVGIQGGSWEMQSFSPMADLPNRVRLCAYGGGPRDFLDMPWEKLVRDVDDGKIKIPITHFTLDEVQKAHELMESGGGGSKMVAIVVQD